MKHPKLNKALLKFQGECGQVEQKLQPRISFGEVSVGYYPADGLCAIVTVNNSDGTAPLGRLCCETSGHSRTGGNHTGMVVFPFHLEAILLYV